MADIEDRIEGLDLRLFERIPSQTSQGCRKSLLAVQRAVRRRGEYVYLEIGSHLGGSLQPHVLDPRCKRIYSIDPRPAVQPDNRGTEYVYADNSTERMLENLGQLSGDVGKIVCFDARARDVDPRSIDPLPHILFIDGEHTTAAALSDFEFCRRAAAAEAVILFHDAGVIAPALKSITGGLRREGARFATAKLGGSVWALTLGNSRLPDDPAIDGLKRSETLYNLRWRTRTMRKKLRVFLHSLVGRDS